MKKLIFTAIAMVAFSGISMAGDIAEKEIVNENSLDISSQECAENLALAADCNLVRFVMYSIALQYGYTREQASDYSYISYFKCMSDNLNNTKL